MEQEKEEKLKEIMLRFGITEEKLKALEEEQKKLSKLLEIKDSKNFEDAETFVGLEVLSKGNKMLGAVVVVRNNEIIEKKYTTERISFPYISGFRAYRELPVMIKVFNLLEEKPDIVFVKGNGICHPRGLGVASHFSLSTGIPTIGISDSISTGEIKNNKIYLNTESKLSVSQNSKKNKQEFCDKKIVGELLKTKEKANPIYVSPGNFISVETAVKITKKLTTEPHKFPDPLVHSRKYARQILHEVLV